MNKSYKSILLLLLITFLFSKESIKITKNINKENSHIMNSTAIMYLDQNIDNIFKRITDFSNYSKNIGIIDKSEIYYNKDNVVKLKMTANILYIFDAVNHFSYKINKDKYQVNWGLDNKKDNTLEYSKGSWELEKLSHNMTKATYKNSIKTPSFMPLIVNNYVTEKGVKGATLWLMKNH
jgi:hypothetical protein